MAPKLGKNHFIVSVQRIDIAAGMKNIIKIVLLVVVTEVFLSKKFIFNNWQQLQYHRMFMFMFLQNTKKFLLVTKDTRHFHSFLVQHRYFQEEAFNEQILFGKKEKNRKTQFEYKSDLEESKSQIMLRLYIFAES